MSVFDRALNLAPWALGCLFVAGIVHLSTILLMPHVATRDAYARLGGGPNRPTLIAADAEGVRPTPFDDPMAALAICRFDLTKGPMRIQANASGEHFLSLAFHDRASRIFYATTDRAAVRGKIDIVLLDAAQLAHLQAEDTEDSAPQELRLEAPSPYGFMLIRALVERESDRARAEAAVQAVSCRQEQAR